MSDRVRRDKFSGKFECGERSRYPNDMASARILRPLRCSFSVTTLLMLGSAAACGRSEVLEYLSVDEGVPQGSVDSAREVTLSDARVVYVELMAPTSEAARVGLMGAHDGIELELLVDRLVPESEAVLILDATGDLPVLRIEAGTELRAFIWI